MGKKEQCGTMCFTHLKKIRRTAAKNRGIEHGTAVSGSMLFQAEIDAQAAEQGLFLSEKNEDFELIDQFLDGDIASFENLVKKYQEEIYYFVLRMVGKPQDAEDVTQMAFVNVFRSLAKFKRQSQFKTWLYKIALNLCLNHIKKSKVRETEELDYTMASEDNPVATVVDKERREELAKAIEELPEKQRLTVVLRTYQDLSYQEVSEVLGCSEGAAKANFHFAVQKLKKKLSKVYGL